MQQEIEAMKVVFVQTQATSRVEQSAKWSNVESKKGRAQACWGAC